MKNKKSLLEIHQDLLDSSRNSHDNSVLRESLRVQSLAPKPLRLNQPEPLSRWFSFRPGTYFFSCVAGALAVLIGSTFFWTSNHEILRIKGASPIIQVYKKSPSGLISSLKTHHPHLSAGDEITYTVQVAQKSILYVAVLGMSRQVLATPKALKSSAIKVEAVSVFRSPLSFQLDQNNQHESLSFLVCRSHKPLERVPTDDMILQSFQSVQLSGRIKSQCVRKEWQLR